jgi:CHRD domain
MNRLVRTLVAAVALLTLVAGTGTADDNRRLRTKLSGFNEVLAPSLMPNPAVVGSLFAAGVGAIFSTGSGQLELRIDKRNGQIEYELTYDFPDATAPVPPSTGFVNQAHLHFGQKHTTGGINVWLCQSADNPAPAAVVAATPPCPTPSGTVTGIIRPAQILTIASQGFPGDVDAFDALLEAIKNRAIYANVHTDRSPGGEIRGQLHGHHGHHDD